MSKLLIDERILADGRHARAWASIADGALVFEDDGAVSGALPIVALDRVMVRFGRAVDPSIWPEMATGEDGLLCGDGRVLRRLRYHARVDAEARDYLVWERPGEEPLAVISTTVAAALRHLVAAAAASVI
jgi:hypothetical protein